MIPRFNVANNHIDQWTCVSDVDVFLEPINDNFITKVMFWNNIAAMNFMLKHLSAKTTTHQQKCKV